jgi:hypothetical protein
MVAPAEVVARRVEAGVELLEVPPRAYLSLELVQQADPRLLRITGDRVHIAEQATYRVSRWDFAALALVLELEEDRRPRLPEEVVG